MNKIVTICVIVISVCVIVLGNIHWKQKISSAQEQAAEQKPEVPAAAVEEEPEWMAKAANLPDPIKEKMKLFKEIASPVKIVAVGSESTPSDPAGWPKLVQTNLNKAYGQNMFSLQVLSYKEGTTITFIGKKYVEQVNKLKPDMIIFEPFTLNDNGKVGLPNSLKNMKQIIGSFKTENPEAIIYLQPSHPIYGATYYPQDVEALKDFAKENKLNYLDHWTNWPDQKNEKIKNMLTENQAAPNAEGNKIWAEYLTNYFVKTTE